MTSRQLEILQHALGVDKYGIPPRYSEGRNHFCAGVGDEPTCRELVALGYMVEMEPRKWLPYFNVRVTDAGKVAMREASPKPPKLSRSQQRYREFLNADSDMSFFEWMKSCGSSTRPPQRV